MYVAILYFISKHILSDILPSPLPTPLLQAREVLKEALKKDKENVRLQLQLLEVETTNEIVNESRVLKIFDALIKNEKNDERKYQFSKVT